MSEIDADAASPRSNESAPGLLRPALDHPALTVAAMAVLVAVPYLIAGPKLLADDFVWLRNAQVNGWLHAGGPRVDGRPGGALMAAITFGLIGAHPLVLALVQTVLRAGSAVLLRRCLSRFLSDGVALAVTVVWLVVPDHLSLEMWASTIAVPVALSCLFEGITRLHDAYAHRDPPAIVALLPGFLLLAAAVAVYELTTVVVGLAVLAVPLLVGRRPRPVAVLVGWAIVVAPAAWALLNVTVYDPSRTGSVDISVALRANLSMGLSPPGTQGRLVGFIGLLLILAALAIVALPSRRPSASTGEWLVLAGATVIACGVAPLIHLATNFQGLDDRLSAVSSIGAAMVWVGGALMIAARISSPRPVLVGGAFALLLIAVPVRAVRTADFVEAGRQAAADAAALAEQARVERVVVVDHPVAVVDHYTGLRDGWNTTAAVQLLLDDPTVVVNVVIDGQPSGPPPDDPLRAY